MAKEPTEQEIAAEWQTRGFPGILSQFVQPGVPVFDIGANIGRMTYAYLVLGATVIAVEPQMYCVEHLRERYGDNGHVAIVPLAVGAAAGSAMLSVPKLGSTIATVVPAYYWRDEGPWSGQELDRTEPVEMTTMDALIETYGVPAFAKVDVEGYEYEALCGLSQFVPLSFEFHPCFWREACRCMARLQKLEPGVKFNHTVGEHLEYVSPQWKTHDAMQSELKALYEQHGEIYFGNIYARKAR